MRFQPETASFQKDVGKAVEEVLVAALSARSAISEGDWLTANFAGQQYRLKVQQLRPVRQVSVIGMFTSSKSQCKGGAAILV